jgi:hypothetical protein
MRALVGARSRAERGACARPICARCRSRSWDTVRPHENRVNQSGSVPLSTDAMRGPARRNLLIIMGRSTRQSCYVAASRYIGIGWPRQIAHSSIDEAPAMRPFSRKKGAATVWRMTVAASIDAYARIAWAREDWLTGTRSRANDGRRTRSSPRRRYLDVYGGGT